METTVLTTSNTPTTCITNKRNYYAHVSTCITDRLKPIVEKLASKLYSLAGHAYLAWGVLEARAREKGEGEIYVWCKRTGFCAQKECNYPHTLRNST